MRVLLLAWCLLPQVAMAQDSTARAPDPRRALHFLEGTWTAVTSSAGPVRASGAYTFQLELGAHVLARHSTRDAGCRGPVTFDCEHGDLLYAYVDGPDQSLHAIYFDNEGHVIHYTVSTPAPNRVEFVSDASAPGPSFRLVYELRGATMYGTFQGRPPGQSAWISYLEWSGTKR